MNRIWALGNTQHALVCNERASLWVPCHSRDFSNGTIANRSHFPETREPTERLCITNNWNIQPVMSSMPGFYAVLLVFGINTPIAVFFTGIAVCWGLHCCRISKLLACVD